MNAFPPIDCNNWYVLSTMPGIERKLKNSIKALVGDIVTVYLPRRELWYRVNGKFQIVTKPFFPGYVFVYKKLEYLLIKSRYSSLERYLHPVCYNDTFAMVEEKEMSFIIGLAGINGIVKASQATISNNDQAITIVSGPLKNITARLLYINKRKRKARIIVDMLNKQVAVTVGLEVLQSK